MATIVPFIQYFYKLSKALKMPVQLGSPFWTPFGCIATPTDGYQTCLKGKKTWHLAVFSSGQLTDALPLAESLSGIRNRILHIDGQEKQWDEVFGFVWCASRRATAYRQVEYCFGKDENRLNPWGCKQAQMDWTEWANWFCYGK